MEKRIKSKIFVLFCIPILIKVYFHFRLFGPGNGAILAVIFFCCLFILENKLNYDDEIMVMQKVWYPLLYIVPGFIRNVSAKILQHFDRLPLNIPFYLPAMYTFIIVGIVIPSSMINRSKKCKKFVLKTILTPFLICRNWQWIEINKKYLKKNTTENFLYVLGVVTFCQATELLATAVLK